MVNAGSRKNSLNQKPKNRSDIRIWLFRISFLLICGFVTPPALAQEWKSSSENTQFFATLKTESGSVEIGRFQRWLLHLTDHDSKPIFPAQIRIGGGMPDHGHGLPTQPQITDYLGDGTYLIEGVKLNMAGRWIMVFEVSTPDLSDQIQFELEIGY